MTTLAKALGETCAVSPLLRRVRMLGIRTLPELLAVAVSRGCRHYAVPSGSEAVRDPGREAISDEELVVLLLLGEHAYEPAAVRCAAQLLGSGTIHAAKLVVLARRERCLRVLAYIADAGLAHDENEPGFWHRLREQIGSVLTVPEGVLPHWTRFVALSGAQRHSRRPTSVWLRPQR